MRQIEWRQIESRQFELRQIESLMPRLGYVRLG